MRPLDDRAEVAPFIIGIGVMMMAALAASVLYETTLAQTLLARQSGADRAAEATGELRVLSLEGYVRAQRVDSINVTLYVGEGTSGIDLARLHVLYVNGSLVRQFAYNATDDPANAADWPKEDDDRTFALWWAQPEGAVNATAKRIMLTGHLVILSIELPEALEERGGAELVLLPERALPTKVSWDNPRSLGNVTSYELR